jgi:hypothetical protein
MADTGRERIADTFQFKHHAVAESLTPQQDSPPPLLASKTHLPTKWKPSNPFAHSYLGRLHRSLHQHQPFFLLLLHPPHWLTKTNPSSFEILNLFSLPCLPTTSTPITSAPTATLLQLSRTTTMMTLLSPVKAPAHLVTISFAHCKTVLLHAIN